MDIIDDFLPSYQFKQVSSLLIGDAFPWYYNDGIVIPFSPGSFQFTHTLFDRRPPWNGPSQYFPFMEVFLPRLKIYPEKLYRIKANLRTRSFFNRSGGGYHTDGYDCSHTSIYYINTNNGYTKFKNGTKVKSVQNRMVVFPSHLEHQGYTCSDKLKRVVINFNYDCLL